MSFKLTQGQSLDLTSASHSDITRQSVFYTASCRCVSQISLKVTLSEFTDVTGTGMKDGDWSNHRVSTSRRK